MSNSISDVFKSNDTSISAKEIFSSFKDIKSLKKKRDLAQERKDRLISQVQEMDSEITSKNEEITQLLSDHINLTAMEVEKFIHSNLHKFKSPDFSVDDFNKLFYKWISKKPESEFQGNDEFLELIADVNDDGHLVVCPDSTSCSKHKNKPGLGKVKLNVREMYNSE